MPEITESRLSIGGQSVCWELSPSSEYPAVCCATNRAGLSDLPARRTPIASLSAALTELSTPLERGHRVLVRPVKGQDKKLAVYDENPKQVGYDRFTMMAEATLTTVGEGDYAEHTINYDLHRGDRVPGDELREKFSHLLGTLSAAALGTHLARSIQAMGGVPLRDTGGFYWLPIGKVDRWRSFASEVMSANACSDKKSKVYGMNMVADEMMVECVGDNIVRDLSNRLEEMQDAFFNDEGMVKLRTATVEARRDELARMRQLTGNFTGAFRRTLDELDGKFLVCETLLAQYSIAAAAAGERDVMGLAVA